MASLEASWRRPDLGPVIGPGGERAEVTRNGEVEKEKGEGERCPEVETVQVDLLKLRDVLLRPGMDASTTSLVGVNVVDREGAVPASQPADGRLPEGTAGSSECGAGWGDGSHRPRTDERD